MAPNVPEEVDVFTIPHSRMKELVNDYAEMIKKTNFRNDTDLKLLLESLLRTFMEFKCHEQIENQLIMKKLKNKLKQLSIQNSAVCNCHNDDDLGRMMTFIKAGYRKKTVQDRVNFGLKLVKALEDFTETFIPHMQEEEEVFQPMLLQYFSYDELCDLKKKVIQQHITKEQQLLLEQAALFKENYANKVQASEEEYVKAQKEADAYCEALLSAKERRREAKPDEEPCDQCGIENLPPELKLRILSYLKPPELVRVSAVNSDWRLLSKDPQLWPELYPVLWSKGKWVTHNATDYDDEEEEFEEDVCEELTNVEEPDSLSVMDTDADVDDAEPDIVKQVRREAEILLGLAKYILPTGGVGVKKLILRNSRALTNATLNKIIQHCPNLEVLDLTQTRTSDAGLKRIGKNGCGSKLKKVILSGCVNITDATLMRLAVAQHQCLNASSRPTYSDNNYNNTKLNISPHGDSLTPGAKMKCRILENLEPAKLDVNPSVDRGGGVCMCGEENVNAGCCGSYGDVGNMKYNLTMEKENGPAECKDDCNAQVTTDSANMDEYSNNGLCEKMVKHQVLECQDDVGMYDLDCLCEMYYRECNILIEGGCEIQTHHCRKENPKLSGPSENKVSPCEMKHASEDTKIEEKPPVLHDDLLIPGPDVGTVDNSWDEVHPIQARIEKRTETACHQCCVEITTGVAVSAIEECVPVTSSITQPPSDCSDKSADMQSQQTRTAYYGLRHLNFSGCFQITDVGLRALGQIGTFPALSHLDLSGCLGISGEGLYSLVDSCPNLEPSFLYYCDNIVDGPHADLASGCQNLECSNRVCCRSGQ